METIKEAIEKSKRPTPYGGHWFVFNDKQLLHLLSLVAEKQREKIAHQAFNDGTYNAVMEVSLITDTLK